MGLPGSAREGRKDLLEASYQSIILLKGFLTTSHLRWMRLSFLERQKSCCSSGRLPFVCRMVSSESERGRERKTEKERKGERERDRERCSGSFPLPSWLYSSHKSSAWLCHPSPYRPEEANPGPCAQISLSTSQDCKSALGRTYSLLTTAQQPV